MSRTLSFAAFLLCSLLADKPDPVKPDPNSPRPMAAVDTVFIEDLTWMEVSVDPSSVRMKERIEAKNFRINGVELAPCREDG